MSHLNIADAARMAGVAVESLQVKIDGGELEHTAGRVAIDDLICVYPNLSPLSNVKLRAVKQSSDHRLDLLDRVEIASLAAADIVLDGETGSTTLTDNVAIESTAKESPVVEGTVELLIRELEWNKELLEQTNQNMAKQLAKQQAMIADQARRLDEKDRFWARQVEIAQSLLPAPEPKKRRKLFGLF